MTEYVTFLTGKVNTTDSIADARGALSFLASINAGGGWDKDVMLGGRAALPLEAMKRRHAHAVEKVPGLPARLVLEMLRCYAHLQAGVQTEGQWRLAVGVVDESTSIVQGGTTPMCCTCDMHWRRSEAQQFTAHALRSGAATEAVHSGLHRLLICGIACVKSMDWLVGNMRADITDRLHASWSLGL